MNKINYDFIEIGCCDFNTLIEECDDDAYGLSVEPLRFYLDALPDKKNVKKVAAAISNNRGTVDMWYVDTNMITDEPAWVRGCNSIRDPHPTIKRDYPRLLKTTKVKCITVKDLYTEFNVGEVRLLKVDAEGEDIAILNNLLDEGLNKPTKIQFELNPLTSRKKFAQLLERLVRVGYSIHNVKTDIICNLQHY